MSDKDNKPAIEDASLGDLTPDANNANAHTERGSTMLSASVGKFGSREAGTVGRNGRIVGGNNRHETYADMDMTDIQIIKADPNVPVFLQYDDLDLTDPENVARELSVALNRSAQVGIEFDPETLLQYSLAEVDLSDWFSTKELSDILTKASAGKDTKDESDYVSDADKLLDKWNVLPGQLWALGEHRIICGDSTDPEIVSRLMRSERAVLCHTDPPYGVDYSAVVESRENQKVGGWTEIDGDELDDKALGDLVSGALSLTDAPTLLLWHSWRRVEVFLNAVRLCGWEPNAEIVWVKNALIFGRSDYQWRHETCIYAKREGSRRQDNRKETTVWEIDKITGALHPTQKPVELFEKGLANHTEIGEVSYDPFSGSGSHVLACENLHRRCRAVELLPKYVAVTLERWADLTGGEPELLES